MTPTEIRTKAAEFGLDIREIQRTNPDLLDVRLSEWKDFCAGSNFSHSDQFAASREFYKARYE